MKGNPRTDSIRDQMSKAGRMALGRRDSMATVEAINANTRALLLLIDQTNARYEKYESKASQSA